MADETNFERMRRERLPSADAQFVIPKKKTPRKTTSTPEDRKRQAAVRNAAQSPEITSGFGKIVYVADLGSVPEGGVAIWGSNVGNADTGTNSPRAGQAYAAYGQEGWIGIPTKYSPSIYLTDFDLDGNVKWKSLFDAQIAKVRAVLSAGGTVYVPKDGLGTGRANLPEGAPGVWELLNLELAKLGINNDPGLQDYEFREKYQGIVPQDTTGAEVTPASEVAATPENTKISATLGGDGKASVDAVIAVSSVDRYGKVKGGTGYAAELALIEKIPVYVFDQDTMTWLTASSPQSSKSGWTKVDSPPSGFKVIAGIGASGDREPFTSQGKQAIEEYVSKLSKETVIHSGGAKGADSAFEDAHTARGGKVVAHSFPGHNTKSSNRLVHPTSQLSAASAKMQQAIDSLGRNVSSNDYIRNLITRNTFQILPGFSPSDQQGLSPRDTNPPPTRLVPPADNGAARVARILNGFADIRARTAKENQRFTNMRARKTKTGNETVIRSQIDRAVGTMGVFGMFHDRMGAVGEGEIQKMIADLAGKLGVDATDEFETGTFMANRKIVAEVFRDFLNAVRHINRNPDMLDQVSRDNLAAMTIEMSRILHDYGTPRDRAIFQNMWKRVARFDSKTQAKFGLTANAAEIAAQGVTMPSDVRPGEQARLQRVAAAQVGQVPQASFGDEPSVTRDLDSEMGRGGSRNVSDLQRYVDEVGLFGDGDEAHIDIKGMVKYTESTSLKVRIARGQNPASISRVERNYSVGLSEFLDGPLGFLADDVLDVNRFFYETKDASLKLTKLERRNEFGTPIALRTNLKYRSGLAPSERISGAFPNAELDSSNADMAGVVDAVDRATKNTEMDTILSSVERATKLAPVSLAYIVIPEDGITLKMPEVAKSIMAKRMAGWQAVRDALAARMGDKEADSFMKTEESIMQYGERPEAVDTITIDGKPNTQVFTDTGSPAPRFLVMPESVAAELFAANPESGIKVRRLGDSFSIKFRAVVSPKYIVLKNGTVVAARGTEDGILTHRRVYPFKVYKESGFKTVIQSDGTKKILSPKSTLIAIERLDSKQFEGRDPGGRPYSGKEIKPVLDRFQEMFGDGGLGFDDPSSGPLFEDVIQIIRNDAYDGLEILAINGDVNPQLEAELISAITEVGDFRVDMAPQYFKARQGAIENAPVRGLGTVKGRTLSPAEARMLPLEPLVRSKIRTGDVKDIMFDAERFGVTSDATIGGDVETSRSIIRGLMLLKKMSMIAGVQIGYGGLRAPDLRYETKAGPIETIRRNPFWMLADKVIYERAAKSAEVAEAASRAFSGLPSDIESISTAEGRAAIQAMIEADEAAMLAARAAVEVARGVLGPEWSIELDPQYQRTRFPENPDTTRRAAEAQYYPYARLMDSLAGRAVDLTQMSGGSLSAMRDSGALSSKADKFFADLQRSGIEIRPTATSPEGTTETTREGKRLYWDPEFGWTFEKDRIQGQVARGTRRFLTSSLPKGDQDALVVEMVNTLRKYFVGAGPTPPFGAMPVSEPSLLERYPLGEVPTFKTIEEVRRVVDPEEILRLFDPVVSTVVEGDTRTETRKSGKKRTSKIVMQTMEEVRSLAQRLGESVSRPVRGAAVPEGSIKIVKIDGTEEVVPIVEFLRRRGISKSQYDELDGIDLSSDVDEDYSWSEYDDNTEMGTPEDNVPVVRQRSGIQRTAKQLALRLAIEYQKTDGATVEEKTKNVLAEFKTELSEVTDVKSLNRLFTKMWYEYTDLTLGKKPYIKVRQLVMAVGKNIWVEKGIALLGQADGTPAIGLTTRPVNEDKSGKVTYGPEDTVVVTKKGKTIINADVALPAFKEMLPLLLDADVKTARPIYEFIAESLGITPTTRKGVVQIPILAHGPLSKIADISIRMIEKGKIPQFDTDLIKDSAIRTVRTDVQGTPQAPALSATGRPKKTSVETGDVPFDDLEGDFYEDQAVGDGDPEMNYAVRQGKLLGLLQPDRLVPKMGPGLRGLDASIRTPMGGSAAGAAIDLVSLGMGGNLTPDNALFTTALNATSLLSRSPLKSTAIGATAALGATALTGGDIGRTLFNLVGSLGGGILGGVASGGLGSLGGSVAGGFVADELWKSMFNQQAGFQIRRSSPPVTTPNIRLP